MILNHINQKQVSTVASLSMMTAVDLSKQTDLSSSIMLMAF